MSQIIQEQQEFEDEVELIDYLRIIWKWKWLIIVGAFFCMAAAGVIGFRMPKVYEVSTIIEPGIIGLKNNGEFQYVDSRDNIGSKIEDGVYNNKIIKRLNPDPLQNKHWIQS